MLGHRLTSIRCLLTLSVITGLILAIESRGMISFTPHPWRYFQWLGSIYFLLSAVIIYYTTLIFKTRIFSIPRLPYWENLLLPIYMSQTLALGYLLKILLGRGTIADSGRFFTTPLGLFPSGHTLVALFALTLLAKVSLFLRHEISSSTNRVASISLLLLFLLAIDLFISGDHYLSDILASFLIHLSFLKLWLWLLGKYSPKIPTKVKLN